MKEPGGPWASSPGVYKVPLGSTTLQCPLASLCTGLGLSPAPSLQCPPTRAAARLTCHHARDGRRGIAALPTGGDVGRVSGQRGPHHLSPWKNTAESSVGPRGLLGSTSPLLEFSEALAPFLPPPSSSEPSSRLCQDRGSPCSEHLNGTVLVPLPQCSISMNVIYSSTTIS